MRTDKDETPAERLAAVKKLRTDFIDRYSGWIEDAKKSNTFLRGTHFDKVGRPSSKHADKHDYLPEDRQDSESAMFPSIPYTLGIIDQMTQYIQHDQGDIVVSSEGDYAMPQVDPALAAMQGQIGAKSQNELVAKMLTARLDKYRDRSNDDQALGEVAHVAAAQRTCVEVFDWVEDETNQEPVVSEIIRPGHYWFDPCASTVQKAEYVGYEIEEEREPTERKYGKKLTEQTEDDDCVWVQHHYTRDYTIKTVKDTAIVESTEVEVEPSDGIKGPEIEVEKPEVVAVYKYENAWRYTVTCGNTVLYDGSIKTPAGRPPCAICTWRPLPHSMIGVSVMDSTRTINRNLDRTQQYIMLAAYRGLPKIGIDVAVCENPDEAQDNVPSGFIKYDSTKGTGGVPYGHIPAAPIPDSLYELMNNLKALGYEMTGADGLNIEDASHVKLSGDALEGLAQDRKGIASRMRDTWAQFLSDRYELILRFIMKNETDTVSLDLPTPKGMVTIETSMPAYGFDDAEFESRFDVNVFSPKNMPKNPIKRAAYLAQIMDTVIVLAERNPALARIYVENADLPNSSELIAYLDSLEAEKLKGAPAQPSEAQMLAAAKSKEIQERMAADVAKSVTDSLEKLSAEAAAAGNFTLAAEIIADMPTKASAAYQSTIQGPQWNPTPTPIPKLPPQSPAPMMP